MQTPERDTTKRSRSTLTFLTPVRPKKRVPLKQVVDLQPKRLSFPTTTELEVDVVPEHDSRGLCWSNAELRALVEILLLHGVGESWPTHHTMQVWEAAAAFVKARTGTTFARAGKTAFYII